MSVYEVKLIFLSNMNDKFNSIGVSIDVDMQSEHFEIVSR